MVIKNTNYYYFFKNTNYYRAILVLYQGQITQDVQIGVGGEEGETTMTNKLKNPVNQVKEKINTIERSYLIVSMVVGSVLFRMGRPEKRQ